MVIFGDKTCQPATNGASDKMKEADEKSSKEDATHLLVLLLHPFLLTDQDDRLIVITDRSQGSSLRVTSQLLGHLGLASHLPSCLGGIRWKVVENTWIVLIMTCMLL